MAIDRGSPILPWLFRVAQTKNYTEPTLTLFTFPPCKDTALSHLAISVIVILQFPALILPIVTIYAHLISSLTHSTRISWRKYDICSTFHDPVQDRVCTTCCWPLSFRSTVNSTYPTYYSSHGTSFQNPPPSRNAQDLHRTSMMPHLRGDHGDFYFPDIWHFRSFHRCLKSAIASYFQWFFTSLSQWIPSRLFLCSLSSLSSIPSIVDSVVSQ